MALLSAFAEMGLKLRLDMPEQAMEVTSVFFRATTPATEALVSDNSNTRCLYNIKNYMILRIPFLFHSIIKTDSNCEILRILLV